MNTISSTIKYPPCTAKIHTLIHHVLNITESFSTSNFGVPARPSKQTESQKPTPKRIAKNLAVLAT